MEYRLELKLREVVAVSLAVERARVVTHETHSVKYNFQNVLVLDTCYDVYLYGGVLGVSVSVYPNTHTRRPPSSCQAQQT